MPQPQPSIHKPRWYLIPVRILMVTFLVTLLSFAVSLFLGILGLLLAAKLRGARPDLTFAYRDIAFPLAALVAAIVLVSSAVMEIRHYRQSKALGRIAEQMHATRQRMKPRIAIPLPHSGDPEYALRAIPQYERAVERSGGQPVRIPLDRAPEDVMKMIEGCDGVLLPGSKADVDPAKYDAVRDPKTEASDPRRDTVDELLLQDAYNMRKPVFGICYGLQILNVYQSGNLIQHIESKINHEAGREVPVAHDVAIEPGSKLAEIVSGAGAASSRASLDRTVVDDRSHVGIAGDGIKSFADGLVIPANSSHHQAAGDVIGDGLRVVARCPDDNIIEALEGTSPDHFVLAVQWHPERSYDDDPRSRALFGALIEAAQRSHKAD